MSNSRFVLSNLAEAATIKNGSGGGAPALDESGIYTMANALTSDRRTLWKSLSASSVFNLDLDLGSAMSINYIGAHGLTCIGSDDTGTLVAQYANSYYPGAWTTLGTTAFALGQRDVCVVAANSVSYRYWRINVNRGTGGKDISLGRVVLGLTSTYDLGGIHSPGGLSSPFQNRIEQALQDGSLNINTLGPPGRDFTLPFNQVTSTVRDQLLAVAASTGSVVFVDAEDVAYEVVVTAGRAQVARNTSSLYTVSLEMKRLP